MTYNYLEVVNATLRRFNEVTLTSATFSGCKGFHAQILDAVNASLRDIYQHSIEWPFNQVTYTQVLTAGQVRYSLPSDLREVDPESFRIAKDDALSAPAKFLLPLTYDDYLQNYIPEEYKTASEGALPDRVFLDRKDKFGVVPCPDRAYTVVYEYYSQPSDLSAYDDVPVVPEVWKYVVVNGAEYWGHVFRDNPETAALSKKTFQDSLKDMRRALINRNEYIRSTQIIRAPVW